MGSRCSASPRRRPRAVSIPKVILYHAEGCHLCERAREVMRGAGVEFEEVDIGGDPELESRYREWLPVVEIDGERAFVYYVDADALRRKIAAQT
jgi:glutaredoxin